MKKKCSRFMDTGKPIGPTAGQTYRYRPNVRGARMRYYRVVRVNNPIQRLPTVLVERVTASGNRTGEKSHLTLRTGKGRPAWGLPPTFELTG